jgi:hypothetical protein
MFFLDHANSVIAVNKHQRSTINPGLIYEDLANTDVFLPLYHDKVILSQNCRNLNSDFFTRVQNKSEN